ncbi:MAG TPA: caspase family protein, partial [Acidimicrobiales bacterium]|nr:caspase family protein [Acidimicrobiales bacterium]
MAGYVGVVRRQLVAFVAVAASASLVLNAAGHRTGPEVRQFVRLAAQAAVVPVPRPLPLDSASSLSAAPANAAADAPIATAPDHFTGPAPVAVAPPARLQALPVANTGESGTWAVVVGVNDYPGTSNDLKYAVNDADDAAQALSLQGVSADHVVNLRDGQVSADVLRSAIRWLTGHAGPDAVAVFFYAGHVQKLRGSEAIVTSNGSTVTDNEMA